MSRALQLNDRRGFTLVEIMITILIIAAIAAIAIPSFIGARERSQARACSGQLRQIKYAKEAWAMDTKQPVTSVAVLNDLYPTYLKDMPECPASGVYTIGSVNTDPICSVGGKHVLP